jgi:hypothetical protein
VLTKVWKAFSLLSEQVSTLKSDIERMQKIRQVVKHGIDGVSPDINNVVALVLESMPAPIDGVSPDPQTIAEIAAKLIPTPPPGRDAVSPSVNDVVELVLAKIKKPKDGSSPDPKLLAELIIGMVPKPKDGLSPSAEDVAKRMPTPQRGKTGAPGKDGVSITDVQLTNNELFVYLDGKKKKAGNIKLPAVTAPFRPGSDGNNGGGGSSSVPKKTKYYESNSTTPATKPPAPLILIPDLKLETQGGSEVYRTESQVQFQYFPQLATPVLLSDTLALKAELIALPNHVSHVADFGDGEVLAPGVYDVNSASTHSGLLTYDAEGDPDALFVMIINGAEAVSIAADTALINGAQSSNVYWVVVGALTIGAGCNLIGTYIAPGATSADNLTLDGRILTTTGALAFTNCRFTVPTGTTSLTLGFLTTFILFTGAGALSNTVVTSGIIGSVASNLGAISGFPNLNGNIYTSNSAVMAVNFLLMSNGVAVPSSTITYTFVGEGEGKGFFDAVQLKGLSTSEVNQVIEIRVQVVLGTLIIGNRNIFSYEL